MKHSLQLLPPEKMKDRQVVDLQIVSPIHIGTKEGKLSALEFVVCDGHTHIIDEDRLGRVLNEQGLIDLFVKVAGQGPFSMREFLARHAKMNLKETVGAISRLSIAGGAENMKEFRPFVRDGTGRILLPGTSLKGVFRTALLSGILKKNEQRRDAAEATALDNLHTLQGRGRERAKRGYSAGWLQQNLLQSFSLPSARSGPNRDILRCFTVRDAYPIGSVQTEIIKIRFLCKASNATYYWSSKKQYGRDTGQPLELWLEAVTRGIFRTELMWDKSLFNCFRKENPKMDWSVTGLTELLSLVHRMSSRIFEHEKWFYSATHPSTSRSSPSDHAKNFGRAAVAASDLERWYASEHGDFMRIGFGSGMLATTVNLVFSEDTRQKIRDACGHLRKNDPAPKSRRVWKGPNGCWMPMGWMRIGSGGEMSTIGENQQTPERTELDFSGLKSRFKVTQL